MGFEIVTNCEDKLEWTADKQNLIEALLTPESGLAARLRCQVVRDNFTIYLLKNEHRDRGRADCLWQKSAGCVRQGE